jgi:hypothetical protein
MKVQKRTNSLKCIVNLFQTPCYLRTIDYQIFNFFDMVNYSFN